MALNSLVGPGQMIEINPGGSVQYFGHATSYATTANVTYSWEEAPRPRTPREWLDDQLYSVRKLASL